MDIENLTKSLLDQDNTYHELCKKLLSAEARAFIVDYNQDASLVTTFHKHLPLKV
jgi:tRNA(His) 5'-end guanylyltransferase